ISFGKTFGGVISIELDIERYDFLKTNVNVYGLKNVQVINGNCIDIIPKIQNVDVIYIDPPWGGKFYKYKQNLRLSLEDIPLETLVQNFFESNNPHVIALKLPKNYDLEYMYEVLSHKHTITLYELKK